MRRRLETIHLGGGQKKIDKLHSRGKMTARERIDFLLDEKKPRIEIGAFAGYGMYEEYGGCPSGGVVVVIGGPIFGLCVGVSVRRLWQLVRGVRPG